MNILITLTNNREIISETDKSIESLSESLGYDYFTTNAGIVKSSEVLCIEKIEKKKVDLESISTEDLVNTLIGRKVPYDDMCRYSLLLFPNIRQGHIDNNNLKHS